MNRHVDPVAADDALLDTLGGPAPHIPDPTDPLAPLLLWWRRDVEDNNMAEFMFTFDARYAHEPHPYCLAAHPDGYVVIEALDKGAAQAAFLRMFGNTWDRAYDTAEFDQIRHDFLLGELARYRATTDTELVQAIEHHAQPAAFCRFACGDIEILTGTHDVGDTHACTAHGDTHVTEVITTALVDTNPT